jgi:hypothetical protein
VFQSLDRDLLSRTGNYAYFHEFLFSLNIALLLRWQSARTSFSDLEPRLTWRINAALHLHLHNSVGGYTAFFALALALALGVFAFASLCAHTSWGEKVLRSIAGVVTLTALPACWLYVTHLFSMRGLPNPPRIWLFLELGVAIACAVLYLLARWPFPAWTSILLLALHFGFWGWLLLGGLYFWRAPAELSFPLAGFCACLAWGMYVARQR